MAEVMPSDVLLRVGGRTMARHGVAAVAGARRGAVDVPPTFARADAATCATYIDRDGIVRTAAANLLRVEWVDLDGDGVRESPGLLLEGSRANVVLWDRDLTNAAWVKTTMTAAKDQTGIDGAANSASSLLATAGNATCLQAITLGSSQRAQAVWVKRLVGSGTINMTMDNGATWTVITLTANWTRVTIPSQTLANPTVGFRIVTNADKIAVDYVQNENGAFESSALATTTAAVTRAADSLTLPFNFGPMDTTVLYRMARPVWADAVGDIGFFPSLVDISTANPRYEVFFNQTTRQFNARSGDSGSGAAANIPAGASLVFTSQHKNAATLPAVAVDVGSGLTAFDTGAVAFTAFANQTIRPSTPVVGLYGVLLDLMVLRGLFTLAEASAVP